MEKLLLKTFQKLLKSWDSAIKASKYAEDPALTRKMRKQQNELRRIARDYNNGRINDYQALTGIVVSIVRLRNSVAEFAFNSSKTGLGKFGSNLKTIVNEIARFIREGKEEFVETELESEINEIDNDVQDYLKTIGRSEDSLRYAAVSFSKDQILKRKRALIGNCNLFGDCKGKDESLLF